MAKGRTHYEVLGVAPTASHDEIRHAYVELIKRNHPDHHQGSPEELRRAEATTTLLNEAWSVLEEPESRQRYDATLGLASGPKPAAPSPPRPSPTTSSPTSSSRPGPRRRESRAAAKATRGAFGQFFLELAQPHVAGDTVLVADAYEADASILNVVPFEQRNLGEALHRLWHRVSTEPVVLAVSASRLHLLRARSGWSGWKVEGHIGSWPLADVSIELGEEAFSFILRHGAVVVGSFLPLWTTPEAAEIVKRLGG